MRTFLIRTLLLGSSLISLAQGPTTPPMKLGLWQSDTTSKTQAATVPDGRSSKRVAMSCITKNNWLTLMGPTASNACPKTNEAWTAQSYRFDVQCPGKPKVASVTVLFDDQEHQRLKVDMASTPKSTPADLHLEGQSHWVSSDCGTLSESNPVLVKDAGN